MRGSVGIVLAITLGIAAVAAAAPGDGGPYAVSAVEPLAGHTRTRAYGINAAGHVVGRSFDVDGADPVDRTAIVRNPAGIVLALPTLSGEASAWGINDAGQASGYSTNAAGSSRAVRWDTTPGSMTVQDLGTLINPTSGQPGESGGGYDLNGAGLVTGLSDIPNAAGDFVAFHAVVHGVGGGLTDLGTFDTSYPQYQYGYSISYAANDSGQVVGIASHTATGAWRFRPFVWSAASGLSELSIDAVHSTGEWYATAINATGTIGGHVIPEGGQSRPYYWPSASSAPIAVTMPVSHPYGEIYGINADGVMVGMMWNDAQEERAFVFETTHGVQDLNALVPAGAGWTLEFARDINDAGQIVGSGTVGGLHRGFVLTPPAPTPILTIGNVTIEEGDSGTVQATISVTVTQP